MAITVECSPLVFQKAQTASSYLDWFLSYNPGSSSYLDEALFPPIWMGQMFSGPKIAWLRACIEAYAMLRAMDAPDDSSRAGDMQGYISTIDFQCIEFYNYTFSYTQNTYFNVTINTTNYMTTFPNTFILWSNRIGEGFTSEDANNYAATLTSLANNIDSSSITPSTTRGKLKTIRFYPFLSYPLNLEGLYLSHAMVKELTKSKESPGVTNSIPSGILNGIIEGGMNEGCVKVGLMVGMCGLLFNFEWDNNTKFSVE